MEAGVGGYVDPTQSAEDRAATLERLRRQISSPAPTVGSTGEPGRRPAARSASTTVGPSVPDHRVGEAAEYQREAEQQAKAVCLRLLADLARPRADLERALRKRGFEPAVIGPVLDRFEEVGLVDDRAYADAFVRSGYRNRALSRTALAAKLRSKGLDSELATEAAADIDDDAEEARATSLVAKKVEALRDLEPDVARRRLLGLLARRGYPGDVSIRVVDAALNHPKGE